MIGTGNVGMAIGTEMMQRAEELGTLLSREEGSYALGATRSETIRQVILPAALLGGLAFGAVGLFFTGITPSIEMFNLPIFLFITPMFLFSGTFFPVSNLPTWAQPMALAFPLHHLVELIRGFGIGAHETAGIFSLIYLLLFNIVFGYLALGTMKRRLIK